MVKEVLVLTFNDRLLSQFYFGLMSLKAVG